MAYYKNHKYFKTVKVWLTEEPEVKAEGEEKDDRVYVTLREPTTDEAFSLRTDKEEEAIQAFRELLEHIIIDHNFYADEKETEKLANGEVAETIYASYPTFIKVLTDYTSAVFQSPKS